MNEPTPPERPAAVGYRYAFSLFLAFYLLVQSTKARFAKEGYEVTIQSPPIEQTLPLFVTSIGLLFPQTTALARKLGKTIKNDGE